METLNDTQKEALFMFLDAIRDVHHPQHDSHYLLKWLKARKFDVKKAEEMYRKSMAWREEFGADRILETFTVPDVMKKYYPGGLSGYDKDGLPLWIDPLGGADLKGIMYSVKKSDILKTIVYKLEVLYGEFRRRTAETGQQIDQCVHIIDMSHFGSRFMWRPALDLYIEIMGILENNYPETLKRTYIINAPKLFKLGFDVIKKFIDKDTAKKFKFCDSDWQASILDLVDEEHIPVYYGGTKKDSDGNEKCESLICYGGDVPKECYRKKEDFFLSTSEPVKRTLGRSGTLVLAYSITDINNVLRYVFSTESSDIEFGVFMSPLEQDKVGGTNKQVSDLKGVDVTKFTVVQPVVKTDCSRVPEDGIVFFSQPANYYLYFRNPSRLYRRQLTYGMELVVVDDDKNISESIAVAQEFTEDTDL